MLRKLCRLLGRNIFHNILSVLSSTRTGGNERDAPLRVVSAALQRPPRRSMADVASPTLTSNSRAFDCVRSSISLTFPEAVDAKHALQTLQVDAELQPDKIHRTLSVQGADLLVYVQRRPMHACCCCCCCCRCSRRGADRASRAVTSSLWHRGFPPPAASHFEATEIRLLRAAVSSFYDMAVLVARTLLEFKE